MKVIKIGILAFSMAILTAACGNGNGNAAKSDSTATSTTTTTTAAPNATPASAPKMDTPTAAPAKPDTSNSTMNK